MQQFKGRVVVPGTCTAEALVSHGGFNTLASYQMAMMFGDKQVKCGDQNNPDIYRKPMIGKALCLPQTIGSTTGGMVLFTVCSHGKQPPVCSSPCPSTPWLPPAPFWAMSGPTAKCPWWTPWATNFCNMCRPA